MIETLRHPTQLLGGRHVGWLLEYRADDRGHHRGGRSGHEGLGIAGEVDPASLPGCSKEQLVDRPHEPAVGVADHQAHAGEAALDQAADERRPGVAFVVAAASSSPSTRRSPVDATPIATRAAMLTTRPLARSPVVRTLTPASRERTLARTLEEP